MEIGKPVRRHTVVPRKNPVRAPEGPKPTPRPKPAPKAPAPKRSPEPAPEKEKVDA